MKLQLSPPWRRLLAPLLFAAAVPAAHAAPPARTPIEHVIVIVGENRGFDHLFGLYEPRAGAQVGNLLSRGIVDRQGQPGLHFALAAQRQAEGGNRYSPQPKVGAPYASLPTAAADDQGRLPYPAGLPNGPYPISQHLPAGRHSGNPIHRFFQMWQQVNGGRMDLFAWTAETAGEGPSNQPPPKPGHSGQGGVALGFLNMATGEAPYLRSLADRYALSDNHHAAVMGGTSANYFALATADVAVFAEGGRPATPPRRRIENPDPQAGTHNWYTEDGYDGGSYVACADRTQPGVAAIQALLQRLPYRAFRQGNCAPGAYYLVNNLDPAYSPDGQLLPHGEADFRLTPQHLPSIGDALSRAGLPWKWYAGGRRNGHDAQRDYCATCDPLTSFTRTMTGPDKARLQDLDRFFDDAGGDARAFPAVAFIAPADGDSGHPGYSSIDRFEALVRRVVDRVQQNAALWQRTAIIVTFDEGGGYYDSGPVQFIDFFGDAPRVPLIVVSPHARAGHVDHHYTDHASVIKFIRANWGLPPLSARSRDNLPNPRHGRRGAYLPLNPPALGDLMPLFNFRAPPAPQPR